MHKIPTKEKAAKKSKIVELNYVNRTPPNPTKKLFSPPVEKPVESVEKYLLSTAIPIFPPFRPLPQQAAEVDFLRRFW